MSKATQKKKIIKRIIIIAVMLLLFALLIYCGDRMLRNPSNRDDNTPNSTESSQKPPATIYKVSGKEYVADISTINIAWDEGEEPTDIQKTNFINMIKKGFGSSVITFENENSFTMTGTDNANHDFVATECERVENELYKEISKGNVDVVISEGKISFLCDFFIKQGFYISIDYKLKTSE